MECKHQNKMVRIGNYDYVYSISFLGSLLGAELVAQAQKVNSKWIVWCKDCKKILRDK